MRRYTRRNFLGLTASASVAAVAAACGGDGDSAKPSPTGAVSTAPPSASPAATPAVTAGADNGAIGLRWFGQSMFLLTAGETKLLLDPFNNIGYSMPAPLGVNAATITHEHPDHNNGGLAAAPATVLRGLTSDGWADIDQVLGDVRIRTIRTYHDDQQGAQRGRNAVFVYEVAGLRIVHLGDLGHQLDDAQKAALGGPVDVLMVPVGGTFTIDAAAATSVVNALQPRIVFPMHYRTARAGSGLAPADAFLEGKTVQRTGSTDTRLAQDALPGATTVMVLDYE
jgi:L-ascorbate metabolism protein UlaG (beta-lactamase superfamily)